MEVRPSRGAGPSIRKRQLGHCRISSHHGHDRRDTSGATPAREVKMARSGTKTKRYGRRDFLQKSAGAAAAIATFAVGRKAFAAEPVNIGGLYTVGAHLAQSGP